MPKPIVLITGSSGGLGRALCAAFATCGAEVIAHARERSDAPAGFPVVVADLAGADAADQVMAQLRALGRTPDIVVHNAAVGWYGAPDALDTERLDELLGVNVWAPIALTQALLPAIRARRGAIAFVSSVAAAVPAPDYAAYAATKAALDGFARNLRIELAGVVDVLSLWPGGIQTNMHARSGVPDAHVAGWRLAGPATVAANIAQKVLARRAGAIGLGPTLLRWAGHQAEHLVDALAPRPRAPRVVSSPAGRAGRRVLITGAADGIGLALARAYVSAGACVVGVDFDKARALAAEAELGDRLRIVHADLAAPEQLDALAAELAARGPYDVLIQNAGINAVGAFETGDLSAQRRVFDVNLRAPLRLTTALLAARAGRAGACWIFLSSLSHYASYPGAAVYAATKDGVAHFARSLDAAVRPAGMRALRVHPGPTRTAHAARYSPDNRREARRMPPAELAARIVAAAASGQRVLIPGLSNRLFALAGRWVPGLVEAIMKRTLLDRLERS